MLNSRLFLNSYLNLFQLRFNSTLIQISFTIGSNLFGIQCKPKFNLISSYLSCHCYTIQIQFLHLCLFNLIVGFMKFSCTHVFLVNWRCFEHERFLWRLSNMEACAFLHEINLHPQQHPLSRMKSKLNENSIFINLESN